MGNTPPNSIIIPVDSYDPTDSTHIDIPENTPDRANRPPPEIVPENGEHPPATPYPEVNSSDSPWAPFPWNLAYRGK